MADMAKDVKELNFGYNNDVAYDSCHRGLSPFAVIGVSMATASKRRPVMLTALQEPAISRWQD
jgi:hypothetical protein